MKRFTLLLVLMLACSGCTAFIRGMKAPDTGYAMMHSMRGFGGRIRVPNQTGGSFTEAWVGLLFERTFLIPYCVTPQGEISMGAISDDFKLENSLSLSSTTKAIESVTTGWKREDGPPPARYGNLFSTNPPALKPVTP